MPCQKRGAQKHRAESNDLEMTGKRLEIFRKGKAEHRGLSQR